MKTYHIEILKSSIFGEVYRQAAYAGSRTTDNEGKLEYGKLLITPEDKELMDGYILEAMNDVGKMMQPIFKNAGYDDETVTFDVGLTERTNMNLTTLLETSILLYFSTYIMWKWLLLNNNGRAEEYMGQLSKLEKEIKSNIYHKNEPQRPA